MHSDSSPRGRRSLQAALALASLVTLGACASSPPAAPAIAAGTASLETATSAGAPEYAASQLNTARAKLERARQMAAAGRDREALQLAEQADVDAQLARATAASERSRLAVAELEASLRTLREEMSRTPAAGTTPRTP